MRSRAESLEFALLGLLSQGPLHGYELRKRMSAVYGPFRALSFSVIYPQLRRMQEKDLIEESFTESGGLSRRSRIVYSLTGKGKKRFAQIAETDSPDYWEDEGFGMRFAFFSPTPKPNRVRILEGRLRRLSEKRAILQSELDRTPAGIDKYCGIAIAPAPEKSSHVVAADINDEISFETIPDQPASSHWINYIWGVVQAFKKRGFNVPAFNAVIQSEIPVGAGLSSSAALEVVFAKAFN